MYSETAQDKKHATYQTYEKIGENRTRLTFDLYIKNNFMIRLVFGLMMKKKYEKLFRRSLENLVAYMKKNHQEGHKHDHEHHHEHAG